MKRIRLILLLAFALLFVQQGGLAHGIAHTLAEQQQSLPHDAPCELCAAYGQLGSAPISTPQLPPALAVSGEITPAPLIEFRSRTILAAPARAPPRSTPQAI
jgi:hypothetical protein